MPRAARSRVATPQNPAKPHPMTKLTPIESEFPTTEDATAHDAWFRAKVERAMASTEPGIPHDQVMAEMQAIIARARNRDLACHLASRGAQRSSALPHPLILRRG